MKIISNLVLIFLIGFSFLNFKDKKRNQTKNSIEKDTTVFVIIPYESTMKDIFGTGVSTNLNTNDFKLINSFLKIQIDTYNIQQLKEFEEYKKKNPKAKFKKDYWQIDLKNYKRQYVAVINQIGEKEVWVNCFCWDSWGENEFCKHQILDVSDGGKCFFNLKINLTRKKVYDFWVNGEA